MDRDEVIMLARQAAALVGSLGLGAVAVACGGATSTSTGAPPAQGAQSTPLGVAPVSGAPLSHAGTLQQDATDLYFTFYDGVIHRQSKSGGPIVDVVTDPCNGTEAIAVDDTYVYWSRGEQGMSCPGGGVIARVPKSGGPIEVLANALIFPGKGGLTLDDTYVYATAFLESNAPDDGPYVYAFPKAGGAPIKLTDFAGGDPVNDGRNVYWLGAGPATSPSSPSYTLVRTARDGSASTTVATIARNVTALAFFDDRIYWVESGAHAVEYQCNDCSMPSAVRSMGPADTDPVTEVTLTDGSLVHDLVVDHASLWLDTEGTLSGPGTDAPSVDDHTGKLLRVARGSAAAPTPALSGLPFDADLALDATAAYALGDALPLAAPK
jgi:hypothetical protein